MRSRLRARMRSRLRARMRSRLRARMRMLRLFGLPFDRHDYYGRSHSHLIRSLHFVDDA